MATVGIELSDVGANCVLIGEDGSSRTLAMGGGEDIFPAYAYARAGELTFGSAAQDMAFVYPRRTCSEFLDDLSFQSTNLDGHYNRVMYSQLAYEYLQILAEKVREEVGDVERVVLATPGHFLEDSEKSEERLGILLGILSDVGMPVAGIVDMAAASLHSEGLWNVPDGERIFHVDLLAQAIHISVFHKRSGLERVYFSRLPQYGYNRILDRFTSTMANRFLVETSFDITEDRNIERAFHAQAREMLSNLGKMGEASLEVSTREKSRQMTISRDLAAMELAPQVKALTQLILRAVNDLANGDDEIQIAISDRAANIQGLKGAIIAQGLGLVKELQPESAAFGAANYGKDWEVVDQLDEVRVEVGISASEISQENQGERGARLATVRVAREGRALSPTHIVCDGLAHEMVGNSFSIGVGESGVFDLIASSDQDGNSLELCRLIREDERWLIRETEGATVDFDRETGLKAGDTIDILMQGSRKRLLLIHCIEIASEPIKSDRHETT